MGNLKRFLSMTLTMLMVVGCFAMTGGAAAFDDVVDYQQQIDLMSTLKIIEGYSDEEFGPDNDVERWHMALWIAKIMTGKVDDAYVNWYSTQNNTAFADLDVDHFFGSISYCNENGVVIGTSATTFDPAKGIMIQDVFTMVVRMLGYGSSSMDANYPWSFVDKAIQLGLDNGLAEDYNNEDVATREQAAVILYNALFALKADGTTYAEAKFNLTIETVVLTGTSKANMFETGDVESKKLAGEKYVAFNALNDDGTLGSETFYLLKSWFGFDEETDENLYFGQSYRVITKDNYTTLIYCEAVEAYWVDQEDFDGVKDSDADIKIEGSTYKAVKAFSFLNYSQGRKATDDLEVIVYNTNGREKLTLATSYVMDADRNILAKDKDKNGKDVILLYYNESLAKTAATWKDAYLYKLSDGTFVTPSVTQWDAAKTYDHTKTTSSSMQLVGKDTGYKSHDLYNTNAYSDTALYDDNFDGIYDRAIYTYYKFGFISYNDDKHITIDGKKIFHDDGVKYEDSSITYVTADGEVLTAADVMKSLDTNLSKGNYVLYTYNTTNRYVMIKEFFTPNQGLVTSIDKRNSTITFDQVYYNVTAGNVAGSKFELGNAKLPGATKDSVIDRIDGGDLDALQGRNIHYIEKDGHVLAIYEAYKNAGNYLVFDSVVGINSTGYVNALVYNNGPTRTVVTIASMQGDWYGVGAYAYTSNADWLNNNGYGELFSYTVDALGNYHVEWLDPDEDYTYYYNARTWRRNVGIEFQNGVAIPVFNGNAVDGIREFRFFENADSVAIPFEQFGSTKDSVIVIKDRTNVLHAFQGIPDNNAFVTIFSDTWTTNDAAIIFVDQTNNDDPSVSEFIYIRNAEFSSFRTVQTWTTTSNDTVIFIDDDAAATEIITNQTSTGYGVTLGAVYSYNKTIDFVRGGVKNDVLTYNGRLTKGNFYYMKDGYVERQVTNDKNFVDIGYLQYIDTYEAVWTFANSNAERTNYRTNYLYELKGTEITDVSSDDDKPQNMIKKVRDDINTDGAYAPVYYYAGNIESSANVFIYQTITKGTSASHLYERNDWISANVDIVEFTAGRPAEIMLETYDFQRGTDAYTAFNWFEITQADYNALASNGFRSNDAFNQVIDFLGTNVLLYQNTATTSALVAGFNDSNVLAFTQIMYVNGGGYKYFVVFTSNPAFNSTRVGAGDTATDAITYTLRWSVGITEYTIKLDSFGLEAARFAFLSYDMDNIGSRRDSYNGRATWNWNANPNGPEPILYANYKEMFTGEDADWSDRWLNYVGRIFSGPITRTIDQSIGTWSGTMYLEVPLYDGYDYTLEVVYFDGYTDGTGVPARWTTMAYNVDYKKVTSVHDFYDAYEIYVPSEENVFVFVNYHKDSVKVREIDLPANGRDLFYTTDRVLSNRVRLDDVAIDDYFLPGETLSLYYATRTAKVDLDKVELVITYTKYINANNKDAGTVNATATFTAKPMDLPIGEWYFEDIKIPADAIPGTLITLEVKETLKAAPVAPTYYTIDDQVHSVYTGGAIDASESATYSFTKLANIEAGEAVSIVVDRLTTPNNNVITNCYIVTASGAIEVTLSNYGSTQFIATFNMPADDIISVEFEY